MDFNFEDFIPVYPLQDDPDIQYKIGTKKEFLDYAGVYNEKLAPGPGNLYKHQEAFKRYMIQYDRMLNIHSVGTGKTCALVAVAEYMKKNPYFKKVYVLEKGDSTKNEFKKQIVDKCTPGTYVTDKVREAKNEAQKSGAITRAIKSVYNIMSYKDLVKEVKLTGESPEEIEKNYSGCIFLVDEAHNLLGTETKSKRSEETGELIDKEPENINEDKMSSYNILWKLFHNVKRSKIILASATPMINYVKEIAYLMNLILPEDQQMPLSWDYDKVTLKQLEPFFRGRISYVRGLDTGAEVEYQGQVLNRFYEMEFADEDQDIPFTAAVKNKHGEEIYNPPEPKVKTLIKNYKSQTVIFPTLMSDFQLESYKKAFAGKKNFRQDEKQAACLVFPDGSYGGVFDGAAKLNTKAGKYIEVIKKNMYKLSPEFKKFLKVPGNLYKISCKYDFIISNELLANEKRKAGEIVGGAFCYNDLVTGGGLIVFSKILEDIYGFDKYNESGSVFNKDKSGNFVIRKDFDKKLRYGILKANMETSEINSLLELFNSKENVNGEYCQIIIGSEIARDGINIFNVLRGYLVTPGWHESGTVQALARFIRADSHNNIIKAIQDKMFSEGKDPTLAKAKINVYKLASVVNIGDVSDSRVIDLDTKFDKYKSNSVDLDLYALSDTKDISIRRMMRFLKQCSFDCSINYSRNVRDTDVDGSVNCDYGKCQYVCYTSHLTNEVDKNKVDYSTYDILYSDDIVKECRGVILNILIKKNSISIKDLYNHPDLAYYKKRYINMAIDYIIKEKLTINNSFGFPAFVNTDGNTIFSQLELPNYMNNNSSKSSIDIYKNLLFGYKKIKFDEIIGSLSNEDDDSILQNINDLSEINEENFEKFSNMFNKLSQEYKVKILEDAILIKYLDKDENDFIKAVLRKYENFIYFKNEPLTDITNTYKYFEDTSGKKGKVKKLKNCPVANIKYIGEDKGTEKVYIHTLAGIKSEVTSFKVNTQFLSAGDNIRIFKKSEGVWRDVNDYECSAYKNIITKATQQNLEKYKKFKYAGTILQDNKFRIYETAELNFDTTDKRSIPKGTVCTSYKQKFDLINILLESDYMPDYIRTLELPYETREEMEDYLLNGEKINKTQKELEIYSDDDLMFFIKWFTTKSVSKQDICSYIQELFEQEGRIEKI